MDRIKKIFEYIRILNTRGFWVGFIAGLFYFGYAFWWLWALYPLESMGVTRGDAAIAIITIIFSLCVLITSIFWGGFGFFTEKFLKSTVSLVWIPLVVASAFVFAEYSRSIFFSIFWFGGGGAIGPYWPLGNISYFFVDISFLARLSSFLGIYGINFLLIYFSSVILLFFSGPKRWRIYLTHTVIILSIVGVLNLIYLKQDTKPNPPILTAIVQTDIGSLDLVEQEKALSIFEKKLALISLAAEKADLIVLPEGAGLLSNLSRFLDQDGLEKYFDKLSDKEVFIVDNSRMPIEEDFNSVSTLISSKNGLVGVYSKEILVPFGEFMPYIAKLPIYILNPSYASWFSNYRASARGSDQNIVKLKDTRIKLLICSELVSPGKSRLGNPNLIITIGSYSIWNSSQLAKEQILSAAKFRAIENRKYLILASNSDQSYIINDLGIIEKKGTPDSYELLTGSIIPNTNRTWYNYVGDWPILLLSSVFLGLSLKKIRDDTKS